MTSDTEVGVDVGTTTNGVGVDGIGVFVGSGVGVTGIGVTVDGSDGVGVDKT